MTGEALIRAPMDRLVATDVFTTEVWMKAGMVIYDVRFLSTSLAERGTWPA